MFIFVENQLKHTDMKNLIIVLLTIVALSSCTKEDYGQYHSEPEHTYNPPHDSLIYVYGGTLTNTGTATNDLVGTRWVLTRFSLGVANSYPNDTLDFVSINTYTINSGAVRMYQLGSIPSSTNFDLSLYDFFPFGGSNYSGNVGGMFIQDGETNGAEFHNIQNTTSTISAWFIKLP